MTHPMIEEAARAAAEADCKFASPDAVMVYLCEPLWEAIATAALRSLLDVSEDVVEAGAEATCDIPVRGYFDRAEVAKAIINAAINKILEG